MSFIFLPVPKVSTFALCTTSTSLHDSKFSFKFFFASLLILQPPPSGIQQKPRSTSEAFKVKVCTEVPKELAHPSAPTVTQKQEECQTTDFFQKNTLGKLHLPIVTRASCPLQGQLSAGEGFCSPGHSRLSPQYSGKAQHT